MPVLSTSQNLPQSLPECLSRSSLPAVQSERHCECNTCTCVIRSNRPDIKTKEQKDKLQKELADDDEKHAVHMVMVKNYETQHLASMTKKRKAGVHFDPDADVAAQAPSRSNLGVKAP